MAHLPAPAPVAAALVLILFLGATGTIVAGGETDSMKADPASATTEPAAEAAAGETQRPIRTRRGERRGERGTELLRKETLQPLLGP
jgi:hypothetical protein